MMKKNLVLILSCLIFLVTGCGNKKLECSMEQDISGNTMKQNVVATFNGDKVANLNMKIETLLADDYVSYIDLFATQLESQFQSYKNKKGITFNTNKESKSVVVEIGIDVEALDDEAKETLGFVSAESNYSQAKSSFEDQGYTCK